MAKKITLIEMDYRELEELVKKVYGFKDYNFPMVQESMHDTCHKFTVNGKLNKYDREQWAKCVEIGDVLSFRNSLVLNKLCADGHIESGDYLINVCW